MQLLTPFTFLVHIFLCCISFFFKTNFSVTCVTCFHSMLNYKVSLSINKTNVLLVFFYSYYHYNTAVRHLYCIDWTSMYRLINALILHLIRRKKISGCSTPQQSQMYESKCNIEVSLAPWLDWGDQTHTDDSTCCLRRCSSRHLSAVSSYCPPSQSRIVSPHIEGFRGLSTMAWEI